MQNISSKDNNLIKHIKKLKEKKYRDEFNEFIVEGTKMVKEAINENAKIKKIVFSQSYIQNNKIDDFYNKCIGENSFVCVPDSIFKVMTEVGSPQGVLAIIEKNIRNDDYLDERRNSNCIM